MKPFIYHILAYAHKELWANSLRCVLAVAVVLGVTGCIKQEKKPLQVLLDEDAIRRPIVTAETPEEALHFIDSLEHEGVVSEAKAEFLRGLPYENKQNSLERQHFKKAYELYSQDPAQDWNLYAESSYKYARTFALNGYYDKTIQLITEALERIEGNGEILGQIRSNLYTYLAGYQSRAGLHEESKQNYEKTYQIKLALVDNKEDNPLNLFVLCVTAAELLHENHDYEGAAVWNGRCEKVLHDYADHFPTALLESLQDYVAIGKMRLMLVKGQVAEANRLFDQSSHEAILAFPGFCSAVPTFLEEANRYAEAADYYDRIDRLQAKRGAHDDTFDTFNNYQKDRYIANRKAGRINQAMVYADSVFYNMDSALVRLRRNNATELAVVYQTHEKELALKDAQTETRIHRLLLIGAVVILLLVSYLFVRIYIHNKELRAKNLSLFEQIQQREQEAQDKLQTLQAQPEESLTPDQRLYRRLCALMAEKQLYTDEELNRDTLANMLGTNAKYVVEAIRECSHGETVMDFITRYRLEHVARLLKTTDEPVNLIGEMSGIPSRATLARLFRNSYGMTCREYRQAAQSSK